MVLDIFNRRENECGLIKVKDNEKAPQSQMIT